MEPGDYILIQCGHNDGGTPGEGKDGGSLRGLGGETVEIRGETVHSFGWDMRQYIAEARSRGAIPIVLSPTVRNEWQDGKVERRPLPTPGQLSPGHRPDLPTVSFIGDSTVKNGRDSGSDGLWGWAHPVASHFDRARTTIENQALGGMSSRTYRSAGHWKNVLALVKAGDFVVMQFGHNDSSAINDRQRARGTLGGPSSGLA